MAVSVDKVGKTWRVRVSWYVDGKRHWKTKQGFRTKSDAKAYGVELEQKQLNGVNIADNTSFKDYFKTWVDTYVKSHVRQPTLVEYNQHYNYLVNMFPNKPLNKVTRYDYQKFINKLGKTRAKNTVKKANTHYRACVKSAVLDGVTTIDFTQNVKLAFDDDRALTVDYLNLDEIRRLLNYAIDNRNTNHPAQYLIISAIYAGARLSELLGLTWDDLHPTYIDINKTYNLVTKTVAPTKNKSSIRTVAIPAKLYELLQELRQNGSNYIFYNPVLGGLTLSNTVNKCLRADLKALKIERAGFHFHSLRHSHVAYLLSLGVDLYAISKRLGHSDTSTTSKVYAYLLDEHKKKIDDIIIDGLNKI